MTPGVEPEHLQGGIAGTGKAEGSGSPRAGQEFAPRCVEFETPTGHPRGDIEQTVDRAAGINLGITSQAERRLGEAGRGLRSCASWVCRHKTE